MLSFLIRTMVPPPEFKLTERSSALSMPESSPSVARRARSLLLPWRHVRGYCLAARSAAGSAYVGTSHWPSHACTSTPPLRPPHRIAIYTLSRFFHALSSSHCHCLRNFNLILITVLYCIPISKPPASSPPLLPDPYQTAPPPVTNPSTSSTVLPLPSRGLRHHRTNIPPPFVLSSSSFVLRIFILALITFLSTRFRCYSPILQKISPSPRL